MTKHTSQRERIFLSPPTMTGRELELVKEVFAQNWIAPVGPHLTRFEGAFTEYLGGGHAVALSSGTAAIHLALLLAGVERGDEVWCPSFTFIGSCNAAVHMGATMTFLDSDATSWNLDPHLLADSLRSRAEANRLPKALILVHLYGQPADVDPIRDVCGEFGVPVIEDAAEALGATYKGRALGLDGTAGAYSFNGNKIITTSGGGMLVTRNEAMADRARYLSTQAKQPLPYYEHTEAGFNYRLSNVLAAIGIGQMEALAGLVERTRAVFDRYSMAFADTPAIRMMPVPEWATNTHWLTCLTLDPTLTRATPESIRLRLERMNIETRNLWKPMHLQPVFEQCEMIGGAVADRLFRDGLCLPSGAYLTNEQIDTVAAEVLAGVRE